MDLSEPNISDIPNLYFIRQGVPRQLLSLSFHNLYSNLEEILVHDRFGAIVKRISAEQQKKVLAKSLALINKKIPWQYTLTGNNHPRRAQLAALHLMFYHTQTDKTFPFWHRIDGTFRDELRDEYNPAITLLILDGITIDSSAVKCEKIYDLWETYSHIPRVLIGSGANPLEIMKKLHLPVNRLAYFNDDMMETISI